MAAFRGHCWQSAVFPDGRAFGYIAYPLRPDESEEDRYNIGYFYQERNECIRRGPEASLSCAKSCRAGMMSRSNWSRAGCDEDRRVHGAIDVSPRQSSGERLQQSAKRSALSTRWDDGFWDDRAIFPRGSLRDRGVRRRAGDSASAALMKERTRFWSAPGRKPDWSISGTRVSARGSSDWSHAADTEAHLTEMGARSSICRCSIC